MRLPCTAGLVVAAFVCSGCSEIRLRSTADILGETTLRTRRETVVGPETSARVEPAAGKLEVVATRICAEHTMRDVRRLTRRAYYDANARGTRNLGITGGSFAAVGGLLIALPAMPVTTNHRADLGFGIPLAALGVTLAVAALSGVVRASGGQEQVEYTSVDEGVVDARVPCRGPAHPAVYEPVAGKVAGEGTAAVPLGRTDERGRLQLDLGMVPPDVVKAAPEPKTMTLLVHGAEAGEVSLSGAAHAIEERALFAEEQAWSSADVARCVAATALGCLALEKYLEAYPDGHHAAEARDALARGKVALRRREQADAAAAAVQAREDAKQLAAMSTAMAAARRAVAAACRQTCRTSCGGRQECANGCVQRTCRD
jgi:hypothetical protein